MLAGLVGGGLMLAVGLTYWRLRPKILRHESWIRSLIVGQRAESPYPSGPDAKFRYWWDLVLTTIWCLIGIAIIIWGFVQR